MRYLVLLAALLAASAAYAASQPVELKAAGPWKVDYSEAACLLSRPYTATDGRTYRAELTFEPTQTDVWLRLFSAEKTSRRDDEKTTVDVDGVRVGGDIHFNIFGSPDGGTTREFWLLDMRKIAAMKQSLRLATKRHGDFTLAADGFQAATRAIDTCMDDLHRSLGIDPTVLKQIAVMPEGSSYSFVDYPIGPLGFDITLLYFVTEQGKVENCQLLKPSGQQSFDKTVCSRLEARGHFKPAKDASGKAIRAPVYEDLRLRRIITRY